MDPVIISLLGWLKTQGPFVMLASLVLWWNRSGQWMWKREVDDKIAAEKVVTSLWKDRTEEWKATSNKFETMALKGVNLTQEVVTSKTTGAVS